MKGEKAGEPPITTVKFANPFPVFNPGPEASAKEQKAICKYTERCTPAAQALHEAEVGHALPPNDGDIHPTKAGYEAIAKVMFSVSP